MHKYEKYVQFIFVNSHFVTAITRMNNKTNNKVFIKSTKFHIAGGYNYLLFFKCSLKSTPLFGEQLQCWCNNLMIDRFYKHSVQRR